MLLGAIAPQHGVGRMVERRKTENIALLCSGPSRLSQLLSIDATLNDLDVLFAPFEIRSGSVARFVVGECIGISRATDYPWRFGMKDSPFLSRKF